MDKLIEGPEEIRRSFIETVGLIGAWASERPDLEKERGFFMFAAQFMGNLNEFTHSELADALNISPATWSRMIKGMKIVADDLDGGTGRELQKSTQRALLSGLIGLVEHALERLLAPDRVENGGEDEVASGQLSAQDVAGITSCE